MPCSLRALTRAPHPPLPSLLLLPPPSSPPSFPTQDMEESDADFDWTKLGLAACSVHALPPHMTVMLGPLDLDTTKRVVKQAERRKKFSTEKTVPDEVGRGEGGWGQSFPHLSTQTLAPAFVHQHVKAQISHEDITTMRIAEINTILERVSLEIM